MKSDLFNKKTINRFISNIEPSQKQKNASKEWINLIEKNELQEEKGNYPRFEHYILTELLGYDLISFTEGKKSFKHEEENMEYAFRDKVGNFLVCFEAKGTKTKDLWAPQGRNSKIRETPVIQINDYLYTKKIPFGVLTNYRIFVLFKREEGYMKFHQFDFLDIKNSPDKLKEFITIFSIESFEGNKTENLYKQSILEERNFTKEFYKLYHETRLMIIKEFKESGIDNKISLHYAQLFLNRLMFIFFAKDSDLLDRGYFEAKILEVLDKGGGIDNHTDYIFGKIKGIFRELDKEIPKQIKGFNGELFKEEIDGRLSFKDYRNKDFFKDVSQNYRLDKKLELNENDKRIFNKHKDKISQIIKNILLMASFDFKTEVNVNILGRIFEQSISDIENLNEEKISKRKKEGVFYTPEYITDYICRNTIIPYLSKSKTNNINELIDEHSQNIAELERKIKTTKILDPACGSGAFLIKSIEILLEIFEKIQWIKQSCGEYQASSGLKRKSNIKDQLSLKKWDEKEKIKNIIENNIFGVDINEESVEITKLSLFLKMARKNKKLIDLSNNIKQGNSLIDDKKIAGDLAFDWNKEFPFKFNVVIGNPPYVFTRGNKYFNNIKHYIWQTYQYNKGKINLYSVFLELSINKLLKSGGYLGFITPETFIRTSTYLEIRKFIGNNFDIKNINIYGIGVFDNVTAETMTLIINKNHSEDNIVLFNKIGKGNVDTFKVRQTEFKNMPENRFIYETTTKDNNIFDIIKRDSIKLGVLVDVRNGIATKADKNKFISDKELNNKYKKLIEAPEIHRYGFEWKGHYINYVRELLHRPRKEETFLSNKIMIQRVSSKLICAYDEDKFYTFNSINNLILKQQEFSLKYILCILNSKLMDYYYRKNFSLNASYTITVTKQNLDVLPIKNITSAEQIPFIEKANLMIKLNKEFYEKKDKFLRLLKHECNIEKVSMKLNKFYELNFDEFIKRLGIDNLSIDKKSELLDFFDKNKRDILEVKYKIEKTDGEINKMVYDLYGITENETIN